MATAGRGQVEFGHGYNNQAAPFDRQESMQTPPRGREPKAPPCGAANERGADSGALCAGDGRSRSRGENAREPHACFSECLGWEFIIGQVHLLNTYRGKGLTRQRRWVHAAFTAIHAGSLAQDRLVDEDACSGTDQAVRRLSVPRRPATNPGA